MVRAKELEEILIHLIGGRVRPQERSQIEEFPDDIEEFPEPSAPSAASVARELSVRSLQPLANLGQLPAQLASDPLDPLGFKRRVLHDPNIETKLSVLGSVLPGIIASVAVPEAGLPALALSALGTLGGGLGGATGKAIEIGREGSVLPADATSQIVTSGGFNALLGLFGGAPIAKAGEEAAAFGLSRSSAAERLPLIERIREGLTGAATRSGEQLGEKLTTLQVTHPERQALLGQHFSRAIQSVQNLLSGSRGQSFQKALMKSAEDLGHAELIKGLLPELELGLGEFEASAGQITRTEQAIFKRRVIQQLRAEGRLPSEIRPETATLDQIQRFKQTLGDIFTKRLNKFGARLNRTELDAFEAYNEIRSAELAAHPELRSEFLRHKHLMDQFRQVKDVLADPDTLESALRTKFSRGSASQVAVSQLLEDRPEDLLLVKRFGRAEEFEKGLGQLSRSALRYAILFPLYSLASMVRHEIFREIRRR